MISAGQRLTFAVETHRGRDESVITSVAHGATFHEISNSALGARDNHPSNGAGIARADGPLCKGAIYLTANKR